MSVSSVVPLAIAAALVVPIVGSRYHGQTDRVLTRIALRIFGGYVGEFESEHPDRKRALRAAHVPTTYREYGATTLLYAAMLAGAGSILGIYVIWAVLLVLAVDPATMREGLPASLEFLANLGGVPSLTLPELFGLMFVSCLTLGVVAGVGTYWLRWWYPSYVGDNRGRRIEAALPGTVAFVYALSRSGMEFPKVIRIVGANRDTYGDAAAEFGVAVRNVETFGTDVVSAIQEMGRHTPSDSLREFSENLVGVLRSGQSLSSFLERQYHEYREEAESQQESLLELLGTLAEAYVTVLVAGPLFLITVLVVIGFSIGQTLRPLQALVYLILPFGNLAFIVYLSMVTDSLNPGGTSETEIDASRRTAPDAAALPEARADGGHERPSRNAKRPARNANHPSRNAAGSSPQTGRSPRNAERPSPNVERLRHYRRFRAVRRRIGDPVGTLVDRPELALVVTVPIAVVAIVARLLGAIEGGTLDVAAIDETIALSTLFVIATFAAVYEVHRRRIDEIEDAVPDLLDRLASVNEAGMPMIGAIDHVRGSDLGPLDEELDRIWADVQWGADLETALSRFEGRVRTRTVSRIVTLVTAAMNASGNLSTVLRIAARQASADRRLKRKRRQAMLEYTVVVYVSFLVFLFIIAILSAYLLPNLPTEAVEAPTGAGQSGEVAGLGGLTDAAATQYTLLFYHATLIQGLLSGFIAGQLSTGDVRAGAKHATLMVAAAFLLFAVVL